jgi:hypothetical protein
MLADCCFQEAKLGQPRNACRQRSGQYLASANVFLNVLEMATVNRAIAIVLYIFSGVRMCGLIVSQSLIA